MADKLGEITAVALMVLSGLYILDHDVPPTALLFAASIWFLHPLFEKAWREAIKRNVEMLVTEDQFRFRRWMRWISIDRVLPHRFALVVHDLARQERDKHELETLKAQKRGKIVQPRRYHQDVIISATELLGQRNDITEICGRPEAQAVLMRLRAIDDVDQCSREARRARPSAPATSGSSSRAPSPPIAEGDPMASEPRDPEREGPGPRHPRQDRETRALTGRNAGNANAIPSGRTGRSKTRWPTRQSSKPTRRSRSPSTTSFGSRPATG